MRIHAAVLAGGASRRMGTDKATLVVDGRPLLHRITAALWGGGVRRILWVGGRAEELRAASGDAAWRDGVETVDDREPGSGPLGGVVSGYAARGRGPLLVLPCDLPRLGSVDVTWLTDQIGRAPARPLVGTLDGTRRPDVAWWTVESLDAAVVAHAEGERSLRAVQGDPTWRECPLLPGFADADSPEDLPGSGTVAP